MENRYSSGVFVNLADCTDTSKEAEFNKWSEEVFLPGLVKLGYIQNPKRYKNVLSHLPTFQGRPKYLTVSEVYHDDLHDILKKIHKYEEQLNSSGKGFDAFVSRLNTMYGKIGPEFRTERSGRKVNVLHFVLLGCFDLSREEEFNKWYNDRHSPETIINDIFSFDTGYRFKVIDPNDPMPHQSAPYLSMYETPATVEETLKGLAGLRKNSTATDQVWVDLLTIYYAGQFAPINP